MGTQHWIGRFFKTLLRHFVTVAEILARKDRFKLWVIGGMFDSCKPNDEEPWRQGFQPCRQSKKLLFWTDLWFLFTTCGEALFNMKNMENSISVYNTFSPLFGTRQVRRLKKWFWHPGYTFNMPIKDQIGIGAIISGSEMSGSAQQIGKTKQSKFYFIRVQHGSWICEETLQTGPEERRPSKGNNIE